jgi:uncharacterized protein with PIN domain/sulfur carrier protein ThiS
MYGPLNDFLPADRRQVTWSCAFDGRTSVKDLIERFGVPHPEIDLILVNGTSVSFERAVQDGDRIAVFPAFQTIDIAAVTRVRPQSPNGFQFILDGHLAKLARHLRLVGVDAACPVNAGDDELADRAARDGRILLTRDQALLKRSVVAHGYFVRETTPSRQLVEVLRRFGPLPLAPFTRCVRCNAALRDVPKSAVDEGLPPRTRRCYNEFRACTGCGRVYWKGSHWNRLQGIVAAALHDAGAHLP